MMKKLVLNAMLILTSLAATSQSLTVTYTLADLGGSYSPDFVLASWVENSSNTWVKTTEKYGTTRYTNLLTWKAKTGAISTANRYNTVDAVTGSTLFAQSDYIARTTTWNCTDVNKATVADGNYTFWIEYTSSNGQGPLLSIPFVKGAASQHLTPSTPPPFSNIVLNFVPKNTAINNTTANQSISVYPVPSNGVYKVSLQTEEPGDGIVSIINEEGKTIKNFTVAQNQLAEFDIDITSQPSGIYVIKVSVNNKVIGQEVTKY